jgi:hypothetical protein
MKSRSIWLINCGEKLMSEHESERKRVSIEWHVPEHVKSRYANNIVVQHSRHEFTVSFFEAHPPLILGSAEERQAQLDQVETVRAECVARIIVSASQMPEFVEVLQANLDKYRSSLDESE